MQMPNFAGLIKVGKTFVAANRPEILLATSLVSSVGSVILAARGGYKARGIVDAAEAERGEEIDVKEKIQLTWLCYMPAAIATTTSVGSIGGLHLVHVKEKKAIATAALAALEEVKKEAKEFEKQNLGVVSEEEKDKILSERADKTPVGEAGHSHVQNSDGEIEELYLIRDPFTGRDIWSNNRRIEEAALQLGYMVNGSESASVNNFFDVAGYGRLESMEKLGWSGTIPDIRWTDENGQPICGVRDDGRPWRGFRFVPNAKEGFDDVR